MKFKEFTKKSETELLKDLGEKREALRVFRFGVAGSKAKNIKEGKNLKKEIAQTLTAINQATKV